MTDKVITAPEKIVRKFVQLALIEQNYDAMLELFHEDCIIYEPAGLPYGGIFRAPNAIMQLSEALFQHLDMLAAWWANMPPGHEDTGVIANDEFAVLYGHMHGRSRATGKEFTVPVTERFRVRDGKIVELWVFYHDPAIVADACAA